MSVIPQANPCARDREIFVAALEIKEPGERASYLAKACGGESELRERVESLIAEAIDVGDFLEKPACEGASGPRAHEGLHGTQALAAVTERPGERIGRYKLLQNIGEGGCGVVYMAEQEEPVRRRVALKIIKLGMDTRQVIARFEAERQALALMDHPNIAKVLDAGATETGRPFFVMELVRGIKMTEYCDQNSLPTNDRLELFIQVCNAIQHAHQKGIIHRDIKPSNVLVTLHDGTPVPKVIDFGVAKATSQQRLTDKTVFTAFEQFIGTPAYMSPEQAEMSSLDIDTRSDVYSLGVLLYELLTGQTPFDAEKLVKNGLDECRRTIRLQEPARPSGRLQTMQVAEVTTAANRRKTKAPDLIHSLRGDLDWVVMKCLEKDRTRRYETVNALGSEVRRYLLGEPVLARPPSSVYRFQKFARRHRGAFAATAAITFTLLAGAGLSTWLAIRAVRAEREASAMHKQEALLRRQAENGWQRAREKAALARLNEYVADMNLAHQSLNSGNYGRAVQLLEKHRPQTGQHDFRGFEWSYLWMLSRGDRHTALPTQESSVQSLAFSANGELLAIGLRDRTKVWQVRNQVFAANLAGAAFSSVFSPSGDALYTGSQAGVRKWNTLDWSERRLLPEGASQIALSPDGKLLAAGTRAGVQVLDTSSPFPRPPIQGAWAPMVFSPDGKLLATDSPNGIAVWPEGGGAPTVLQDSTNLFFHGGPWGRSEHLMTFSPDGKHLVAARNNRSTHGIFVLETWDIPSGKFAGSIPEDPDVVEHTGAIVNVAFSPDGHTLATASMDHSIRLWDFAARRRRAVLQGHLSEVWALAFSPDGQTLASGAKDGGLKLWPVQSAAKEDALPGTWQPLGFSTDSRLLAALEFPDTVAFINPNSMEPEQRFQLEPMRFRPPSSVAVSRDLRTLAEGADDGQVRILNTQTRESVVQKVGRGPIGMVVLSSDGRELVTGGFGQPCRWWDLTSGKEYQGLRDVQRAVFSPDDKTLAVFSRNNTAQLWDVPTHSLRSALASESVSGFAASFSPDGRILATTTGPADIEPEIQLWDAVSGRNLGGLIGHKQAVFAIAFSHDGRTLASSSDDSTMRFWNVRTCQELFSIRRLGELPNRLLFSPDGHHLVVSTGRPMQPGSLKFYRVPLPGEIETASTTPRPP